MPKTMTGPKKELLILNTSFVKRQNLLFKCALLRDTRRLDCRARLDGYVYPSNREEIGGENELEGDDDDDDDYDNEDQGSRDTGLENGAAPEYIPLKWAQSDKVWPFVGHLADETLKLRLWRVSRERTRFQMDMYLEGKNDVYAIVCDPKNEVKGQELLSM
ncbi:MAG: hypothetical protein M1829_002725 [Trizodia sp. TS-e1964]|nr:MAG: hypothetical protein M1829_002725 [Trizodia sp. TS-e1964]